MGRLRSIDGITTLLPFVLLLAFAGNLQMFWGVVFCKIVNGSSCKVLWSAFWILGRHSNLFLEFVPLLSHSHLSLNALEVFLFRSVFLFILFLLTQIFIVLHFTTCLLLSCCFSVLMSNWNWFLASIHWNHLIGVVVHRLGWLGNFVRGNRFRTNLYVLGERGFQSEFFVGRSYWTHFIASLPILLALVIVLDCLLNFPFLNFQTLIWHAKVLGTDRLDLLLVVCIRGSSDSLCCHYNLMHWSWRWTHSCADTRRSFLGHWSTLFLGCHDLGQGSCSIYFVLDGSLGQGIQFLALGHLLGFSTLGLVALESLRMVVYMLAWRRVCARTTIVHQWP